MRTRCFKRSNERWAGPVGLSFDFDLERMMRKVENAEKNSVRVPRGLKTADEFVLWLNNKKTTVKQVE